MDMTQKERLLEHLQAGKKIRRTETWEQLGIIEAPSRISELRSQGYIIHTKMVTVKSRYGRLVSIAEWSM